MKKMKPKIYQILIRCIEEGIEVGYNRAFKYTETPVPEDIKSSILTEIINELDLYFTFESERE